MNPSREKYIIVDLKINHGFIIFFDKNISFTLLKQGIYHQTENKSDMYCYHKKWNHIN